MAKENPMVTIERIELFTMRYPMKVYFNFFTGLHGDEGRAAVTVCWKG